MPQQRQLGVGADPIQSSVRYLEVFGEMSAIALIQAGGVPVIPLILVGTTIPSKIVSRDLVLPAYARATIEEDRLRFDFQLRDPCIDFQELEASDGRYEPAYFEKSDILRIKMDGSWRDGAIYRHAILTLAVRDPLEVVDSLQMTFAALDANNPHYWTRLFAKMLNESLGIRIDERPKQAPKDDIPF